MKEVQNKEDLDLYKQAFDVKEIFSDENFLENVYNRMLEQCTYIGVEFEDLLKRFKKIYNTSLDSLTNIYSKNTMKVFNLMFWPIFNDKDFKNKKFIDYNIDIKFLERYVLEELNKMYNQIEDEDKKLIKFEFENYKLKYVYFEIEGGIVHVYKNSRLNKIIFADNSETIIPENV